MSKPAQLSASAVAWARKNDVEEIRLAESVNRLCAALTATQRYITSGEAIEPIEKALNAAEGFRYWLPVLLDHPEFTPTDDPLLLDRLSTDLERLLDLAGMSQHTDKVRQLLGEPERRLQLQPRPKKSVNRRGFYSTVMQRQLVIEYRRLTGRFPTAYWSKKPKRPGTSRSEATGDLYVFIKALAADLRLKTQDVVRLTGAAARSKSGTGKSRKKLGRKLPVRQR